MNPVRPTSSKLLQAFFNIIGSGEGRSFLDLFAGTGRVSLEAARKGFGPVVAVELDRRACKDLRESSARKKDTEGLEVMCMDIRRAMVALDRKGRTFDVIFGDPPYENGWVAGMTRGDAFIWQNLLAEDGVFVLEHSIREKVPERIEGFLFETRQYGDSCLSFIRRLEKE